MDHGRRTSNLLSYLERIRDRARRDVTMGVTADALRANAEERRRRAARRRERKIIARTAKHSEPIEIEDSPRRENGGMKGYQGWESVIGCRLDCPWRSSVALPEDEGPPRVSSMFSAAELEDLLEARAERIQPVKTVRDAASSLQAAASQTSASFLSELSSIWRGTDPVFPRRTSSGLYCINRDKWGAPGATVKELLSLVQEAEGNGVPEEELEELRQMVSVDLEENLISPIVTGILGRLVDQEAARLHKILLRSTAEAAHN
ncbi:hypothetical protein FOZ62_010481, partial [Perkinsus olseni]